MLKKLSVIVSCTLLAASTFAGVGATRAAQGTVDSFRPLSTYIVPNGGVAEIISATPDGKTVLYTNSSDENIGVVDLSAPAQPKLLKEISMPGEPTSVAVTKDGKYAVAVVITSEKEEGEKPVITPGKLLVIDMSDLEVVGDVNIGNHPDSVALETVGRKTVAVVAIENEPVVVDAEGKLTDAEEPGHEGDISGPGYVQTVALNFSNPSSSKVTSIPFPASELSAKGFLFPDDPQPEYVDVRQGKAAVSLQENNGVAVIDLSSNKIVSLFSTGKPKGQKHDLTEDGKISFTESYPEKFADVAYAGARMPDTVAWNAKGTVLLTADEGEMDLTGGRGWSIWSERGSQIWKDQGQLELTAVQYGHYPDGRSEAGGIEIEGMETAVFGKKEFAFVGSEKGSFVGVYDITNPRKPEFVQLLPTGLEPEGLLALPQNNLFLTSDEESGTISIFEGVTGLYQGNATKPTLHSPNVAWSAISGLAADAASSSVLYAVPDNAMESFVYRIDLKGGQATVSHFAKIMDGAEQAKLDLEGIVRDTSVAAPANAGFWVANEGNAAFGEDGYMANQLLQIDAKGNIVQKVSLPAEIDSAAGGAIRNNGFEGVALSSDGKYLVAAIQREYKGDQSADGTNYARIARYDLTNKIWEFFLYPLERTDVEDDWIGLSEIVNIGGDRYAVIERDKQIGGAVHLKAVYTFSLEGLTSFPGMVTANSDVSKSVVSKVRALDVRETFKPFEKLEGLTVLPNGAVWAALDNDGGELGTILAQVANVSELR